MLMLVVSMRTTKLARSGPGDGRVARREGRTNVRPLQAEGPCAHSCRPAAAFSPTLRRGLARGGVLLAVSARIGLVPIPDGRVGRDSTAGRSRRPIPKCREGLTRGHGDMGNRSRSPVPLWRIGRGVRRRSRSRAGEIPSRLGSRALTAGAGAAFGIRGPQLRPPGDRTVTVRTTA